MDYLATLKNGIGALGGLFQRLAPSSANDAVVVDLSIAAHVRVVQGVELGGKFLVNRIIEKSFSEDADLEISVFLAGAFKELRVRNRRGYCIVPSNLFITKSVDIPSYDKEEIRKIVDLQAGRYTPYARDEIIIDYLSMAVEGQHYTNVLLAILNRKTAERYCRIFDDAGITLKQIAMASEAMSILYDRMSPGRSEEDAVGGIHINEENAELTILDRHQMVFTRMIPVGARLLREDREAAQNDFMIELNKSIIEYQNRGVGRSLKQIIITGLVEGLESLVSALPEFVPYIYATNIPAEIVPYASIFYFTETGRKDLSGAKTSCFELLAALYARNELHIDLTPKSYKLKKRVQETTRQIMSLGITLMAAVFLVLMYLQIKTVLKDTLIAKLDQLHEETFEEARRLELSSTKSRIFRSILEQRGRGLYVFEKIASMIGADMYLTSFVYDDEKRFLKFAGTTNSMSRVFTFVTELEESNFFSSVKTNETKSRRQGTEDLADFEIECVMAEGI